MMSKFRYGDTSFESTGGSCNLMLSYSGEVCHVMVRYIKPVTTQHDVYEFTHST